MVDDETDYRGDRQEHLHDEAGPQVDDAYEEAHGRGREEGARELEPLPAREAALHTPHVSLGEDGLREALKANAKGPEPLE